MKGIFGDKLSVKISLLYALIRFFFKADVFEWNRDTHIVMKRYKLMSKSDIVLYVIIEYRNKIY